MKIEPLISAKALLIITNIFMLIGCSSPPTGYTNTGFPFFNEKANYPCAYQGFYSGKALVSLTEGLNKALYPSEKVISISGVADEVNKNNEINHNNNTLSCAAEITLSNGEKERGIITYSKGMNDSIVMSWMSNKTRDDLEVERKNREINSENEFNSLSKAKYPYMAYVSCGIMGQPTTLSICFLNRYTKTSFEMTNGGNYFFYQGLNRWDVGKFDGELLRIPLERDFSILAQNANDTHILTLKIIERESNAIVFERSTGMFGTIAVKNK